MVYTYDQNSNRLTEDAKAYQYDWNNRLTSIISGDENTSFTYDGDGSRTSQQKIVSGATLEASSYVYDPSQGIPRLLEEIVSGPTLNYVYAGRLLEQTGSQSGTMFYHQDAIGNTLAMTDMTGVAINTYRYDAFGASELISGTAINNRQFTGHVSDGTGLIYMNARYYDPATGRFLTQDTVPGSPMDPLSYNLYAYCKNNPVAYTDPSGHWNRCVHLLWVYEMATTYFNFSDTQAVMIALGCISVDTSEATMPYKWWSESNLSWHFNRMNYWEGAVPGEDSRITHMKEELEIFKQNASDNATDALFSLGRGIHVRQDMDAHLSQGLNEQWASDPHFYRQPQFGISYEDHFDDIEWNPVNDNDTVVRFEKSASGIYSDRFDDTWQITYCMLESASTNYTLGDIEDVATFIKEKKVAGEDAKWASEILGVYLN